MESWGGCWGTEWWLETRVGERVWVESGGGRVLEEGGDESWGVCLGG